jgi:uncharacterized membrane protein
MPRKIPLILFILFCLLHAYNYLVLRMNLYQLYDPMLTPLTTLLGLAFALTHAWYRGGLRAALTLFLVSFVISLSFESLGVATGLVYGPYHYTDKLGPLFLDLVPYIIPAAWFMMMYPALVIAERIAPPGKGWKRALLVAALGGIIMTAWDVVMDPMMVSGGHWVWETGGPYFGIPLQNFWGWWLTTFCVFLIYWLFNRRNPEKVEQQDDRLAVGAYLVTGLSSILVCLDPDAPGLAGAALAGIFALSPWALLGWINTRR